MTKEQLDRLSAAVRKILARDGYAATVSSLKERAALSSHPFVWSVLDIRDVLNLVPDNIKSAWLFVLKRNTPSGSHFHPNSVQHMVVIEGQGRSHVGGAWNAMMRFADAAEAEDAWIVIPEGIPHEFFPQDDDMVVMSFHTCPADELVEIDAATGRPRLYEPSL